MKNFDTAMMRRALQLATSGSGRVSPNPMVGAVITARGRIIGEGFHRQYGGPHAEPNAIASVREADRSLLKEATMYVTLEPCSHFGKTPPCANLIVNTGIPHVVIATLDPFPEVAGNGVQIMEEAGIKVEVGLLGEESRELNRRFMTAHTLKRPYVQLKWAQTADEFMAQPDGTPIAISNPISKVWMHRERSKADAIMIGTNTVINDNPHLNCRLWPCRDAETRPVKVTFDSPRLPQDANILHGEHILRHPRENLNDFLQRLYAENKITSLMVEGGAMTLREFIDYDIADEIRLEISPDIIQKGIKSPDFSTLELPLQESINCNGNIILSFFK